MRTSTHQLATAALASFVAIGLAASVLASSSAHAGVSVVTTTSDLGAIAMEVGGSDVSVTVLAPADADPHYVDPRPSYLVPLSRADLVIHNGLGLEEGWLPKLLLNARNGKILPGAAGHLDASSCGFTLLEQPHGKLDRAQGDIHGGGNPHYTTDPRVARYIAATVRDTLSSLDPDNSAGYASRYETFAKALETFAVAQRKRFDALPPERRLLVTFHRSWPYLIDWLGLTVIAEVEPKPGVSPSPGHTAKVVKALRKRAVKAVLQERHYPRKTSETVARLGGATLVAVSGQTPSGSTYLDHLKALTDALYSALSK